MRKIAGMEVFRLEHHFQAVPGGTQYNSRMVVGSRTPLVGALCNRYLRPRFLSDAAARAWLTHNVEQVGMYEQILPALHTAR